MLKLNDDLRRVQIGRDNEVPIESNRDLWFIWYYEDGNWDAEAITRSNKILQKLEMDNPKIKEIFCVWHGTHRTNLFLMDKQELIRRLKR